MRGLVYIIDKAVRKCRGEVSTNIRALPTLRNLSLIHNSMSSKGCELHDLHPVYIGKNILLHLSFPESAQDPDKKTRNQCAQRPIESQRNRTGCI